MYDRVVDVPRVLCFYGEDAPPPDPVLVAARRALNVHYGAELGEEFRTAGLCLYRDGRDSVAWHGDTIGRGSSQDTIVAIVSLGTARPLLLPPPRPCRGPAGTLYRQLTMAEQHDAPRHPVPQDPVPRQHPQHPQHRTSLRLVATDLDGTVIRSAGTLSARTLPA